MRKFFKKAIATVAALAMAVAGLVVAPKQVKAGESCGDKKIYVSVPKGEEYVGINIWNGLDTKAPSFTSADWAKTMTKVQAGLFVISGTMYDDFNKNKDTHPDWDGLQVILFDNAEGSSDHGQYKACGGDGKGQSKYFNDIADALLNTAEKDVWLEVCTDGSWTIKVGSPVTITATDEEIAAAAEDKMDEAISLEANLDNKAKYVDAKGAYDALTAAQKALVDATKYSKITAALAKIKDIEANAAGDITIYVITEVEWKNLALYGWYDGGAELVGNWPGKVLSADDKNPTYKVYNGTLTKPVNIKFNATGDKQSSSKYFVKGTYWVSIDKNNKLNVSTTKPSNWVEDIEEPTTEAPTKGTEPTTEAPTKGTEPTTEAPTKAEEPTTAADNKDDSTLKILDGADGKYDKTGTYAIRIDEAMDKLVEVLVDGKVVDKSNYTVTSGSTIITFTEAYLATLSDGKHNVSVKFTTGLANTTIVVSSTSAGDVDGGDMIPAVLFLVMFACVAAVSVVIKKRKVIA